MSIKYGNRILREQQSALREKARWLNIQLEEANEEIARLKATVTAKNNMLTGARNKTRKCLTLMNEAMEETVFDFALEYATRKPRADKLQKLKDNFKDILRENAE